MNEKDRQNSRIYYGFPASTEESRAEISCFRVHPDEEAYCWCGYHIVEGLRCCPQCQRP